MPAPNKYGLGKYLGGGVGEEESLEHLVFSKREKGFREE